MPCLGEKWGGQEKQSGVVWSFSPTSAEQELGGTNLAAHLGHGVIHVSRSLVFPAVMHADVARHFL